MDEVIGYRIDRAVAVVTIRRPARRNAMDRDVFRLLGEAAHRAADDPEAGAVLVRGAEGTFSSGVDLEEFARITPGSVTAELIAELQSSFTAFEEIDKPVLAAIEGHCLGAGLQLALACHLRAVAPSASLSLVEVRWGLVPDLGAPHRLPRLVGLGRATELALTGRRVGAEEALAIGLAEVRLPADDPQGAALDYAARLAAGPGSVRRIPRLLRRSIGAPRDEALRLQAEAQLHCLAGPDAAEAVAAAREARQARFVGE